MATQTQIEEENVAQGPSTITTSSSISNTGLGGSTTAASRERNQLVGETVSTNLTTPQIPEAAIQKYTPTEVKADEVSDPTDDRFQVTGNVDPTTTTATATEPVTATEIDTSLMDTAVVGQGAAGTEQAATSDGLTAESKVQNQMSELLDGIENGEVPTWAKPAVDQVEAQLASRGLSRSSIGQAALSNAIITAALPMAQQNAQQEFTLQQQNISNEQQMAMANLQVRQQSMLSDQAAINASGQFNAASENQTKQFMSNLKSNIDLTNAARLDAMQQFNAGQENAMEQFATNLEFARDQFNAQNATQIEQSNLQWRRQVNQANTAGINAVNQANAMNAFNMSNQSLTFMWQEMRDQAKWAFEATQNDEQRKAALAQAALSNEASTTSTNTQAIAQLGAAAFNLWKDMRSS